MKKVFLILIILLGTKKGITQPIINSLLKSMQYFESQYNCRQTGAVKAKVVSKLTFDSIYHLSSGRILPTSEDLIKNGKSASLDFNEALKRLSINYSWKNDPKDPDGNIWNLGFVAEDAGKKQFEIFGKNGWKDGFSFALGQAIRVGTPAILFMPGDCDVLKPKRKLYYVSLLQHYQDVLAVPAATIQALQLRQAAVDIFNANNTAFTNLGTPAGGTIPQPLTDAEKKLLQERTLLNVLSAMALPAQAAMEALYSKDVADFEVANFKKFGYKVRWVNWNASAGLGRFTIYDTAVISLAELGKKSLPRFSVNFSTNFFREAAKNESLTYRSAEITIGNTNYLEEILPSEITLLKTSNNAALIKEDHDALIVNDYASLKKNYAYVSIGGVYNYFPGKIGKLKRFIGFEIGGSTRFKFFEPKAVNGKDVFSLRGGLLFTFEKEKVAKTTIGIIASLTNVPFNDITSKDRFGVGIRIGVPFNF